jgi:predicted methyltransferase
VLLVGAFSVTAGDEAPFAEFSDSLIHSSQRYEWQQPHDVIRMLSVRSGERVAEIGAGKGFFTEPLAQLVGEAGRLFAIETNPDLLPFLEQAVARMGDSICEVVRTSEDDFNLPGDLDMVLTVNTWHHLQDRDAKRRVVRRSLNPGGRFVIIDWRTEECSIAPPVEHRLARKTLIAEMEADGWELTTDARLLPYQYFLIFTPRKN